ncbi:MAG: GNAT family N-acetyltransferase [Oscillospiraceae bacterium]|nr:GNAT family N-acetyltransferase [Oscillospiraceae bacterium]
MNFQNDRYTLRFSLPEDDPGITAIFTAGGFSGGIAVQYLRPQPHISFAADGDESRMMVIVDNTQQGRIAAVGGAVVRTEYVHGEPQKTAYLTGLKIHPEYQKQIFFIAKAFQFLREHLTDCACCYSTILDDNKPVIAMLEKKHRNMPEYRYIGHYLTYCFHGGKTLLPLTEEETCPHPLTMDLTPVQRYPGAGAGHYYAYRENGALRACCYAGDQTACKQYKITGYGGIYKIASMLPTKLLGYPAFPKAGQIIRHGVVSALWVQDNDPALCKAFLRTVAARSGSELLLWGAVESHPLTPAMQQMRTVHYGSRLYEVVWEGEPVLTEPIGMEVALL